jgi:uncharacterized membrane protein YcjF (UPF0283 family)
MGRVRTNLLISVTSADVSSSSFQIGVERVVYVKESLIKRGAPMFAVGVVSLCLGIVVNWIASLIAFTKRTDLLSYVALVIAVIAGLMMIVTRHNREERMSKIKAVAEEKQRERDANTSETPESNPPPVAS